MVRWSDLEKELPEFAGEIRLRFEKHRHHTIATLRRHGAPRISGNEVHFVDDDVVLSMMPDSLKARDLRRDSRVAVHTHSEDPPEDVAHHDQWQGDAKLSGHAVELTDPEHPDRQTGRYRLDLTEAVVTRVGRPPDHLVIESWHPEQGYKRCIRR